jgi:hypothetical protein
MADLLPSLALAGLLWAAIVPMLSYRASSGLATGERLRLALVLAGKTLLWLGGIWAVAVSALLAGGRAGMVVALMALMFLVFGVFAFVRLRAGAGNRLAHGAAEPGAPLKLAAKGGRPSGSVDAQGPD